MASYLRHTKISAVARGVSTFRVMMVGKPPELVEQGPLGNSTVIISGTKTQTLTYMPAGRDTRFVDIFLKDSTTVSWRAESSAD